MPVRRRRATTGFMIFVNTLGAIARPKGRHANSRREILPEKSEIFLVIFPNGDHEIRILEIDFAQPIVGAHYVAQKMDSLHLKVVVLKVFV